MNVAIPFWVTLFLAVAVYWILPRGRDWFLIAVSFGYLASLAPWSVTALLGWFLLFYFLAPKTRGAGSGRLLASLCLAILGYLAFFKYVPPLAGDLARYLGMSHFELSIVLPLGISYFTFKLIHYAIEVSRGNIPPHPPRLFLLYLLLFPIFPAGPIERFDRFLANREDRWNRQMLAEGLTRIIYGLIKKFFFAENILLPLVTWPKPDTANLLATLEYSSVLLVWTHLGCWFLYFYLDFSAYSDLAIGASRLFGFRICENFNFPLVATNLGDFWKRWHMSLAQWCQGYVYMPLIGMTRNPYLAVYAAMISIGLWHAGSLHWLCWGVYHATGLVVFQTWLRVKRKYRLVGRDNALANVAGRVLTWMFVTAGYAFLVTQSAGIWASLRLLAKLGGLNLPA
jgi:alginate O-acetyltransferase complex protein AlgI